MKIGKYSKEITITEIAVGAGILAFAYWRYSRMTPAEKQQIHADLEQIGINIAKDVMPDQIKTFLPAHWK